jgi:hypothetical protein
VYRARAAIGLKESDNALPAQGGDDRLIRPTGPKFVTYSSAVAGVTAAMTSAAQAMEVERSSWTIELVSFQFRPIRENQLAAMHNLIPHRSDKFVLQCGTTVAGLMESKTEGVAGPT